MDQGMLKTHNAAENKYDGLRKQARNVALNALPLVALNSTGKAINLRQSVRLTEIDLPSILASTEWGSSSARRVDWNWKAGSETYAWRNPKRFEIAIWYQHAFLCGLSIGRPTWSGNKLRLDFIEASPKITPLSGLVTDITIAAAEAYADAIGAVQIRIMNPINEKVLEHYLAPQRGFSFNQKGNFCFKDLL
jgi:hypothetical protein